MLELRGMTWNHIRGTSPVRAAAKVFTEHNPGVDITWDVRSLKDFEDFPVEIIARDHDLMMIDHPFIGEGVAKGILEPYDAWLEAEFLADQKRNSVGPSHDTYHWQGRQWGLAVDVAAQACAWRPDLLDGALPKTWREVFDLARDLRAGSGIGIPLVPTHAYSSFVTLCANLGGTAFWDFRHGIAAEIAVPALETLARLCDIADPRSMEMNPIDMLDAMAHEDSIVYAPLIYGYSNYARAGYAPHLVRFGNIPSAVTTPRGSQIGGVGLAVSALSPHKKIAMAFAQFLASADCQTGLFYSSGGQPGHRQAWIDPTINRDCHGFFADTLATLELGFVRPRLPGYNRFQEAAGIAIHHWLRARDDPRALVDALNAFYRSMVDTTTSDVT